MKLLICICTYKRNKSLINSLKSFKKAILPPGISIEFLIVDNTKNGDAKNIINKFKLNFKFKINYFIEKKRGVVFARNKCLKELRKINCKYLAFFDDDGEIDKHWFINFKNILKTTNVKIITGPQIYPKNNLGSIFEKKIKKNNSYVNWAATNNVIIKKKIILSTNLYFDVKLNKFGMGEDQLFFLKLNKLGNKIIWNKDLKVYEKSHSHRKGANWIMQRSFRLGVLGNHIDKKIYGTISGFIINYLKFFYYIASSVLMIFNPLQRNFIYKFINFFFTAIGRLIGPLIFNKIEFYKK